MIWLVEGGIFVKIGLIILLVFIVSFVLVEGGLRFFWGFGRPPLYQSDQEIGYLLAPNQRLKRFGNRIEINQYSMRSGEIDEHRTSDALRVLMLGDSIVNGNGWTDQGDTLSARLERQLETQGLPPGYQSIEVLNVSANSWGPRNELAYLKRFGTFEAQVLVLVINTDDLFGTQPTDLQVGRDRNYPDKAPGFALLELFNRYGKKQSPIPGLDAIQQESGDRVGRNLEAISGIIAQVQGSDGKLLLAHTPLKREVLPPGPRDYERVARQRLQDLANQQGIPYIDFLDPFQKHPSPEALYRDHIHLSPEGNHLVCQALSQSMISALDAIPQP
jgi:GDSL-like Lipase/Acylhydrolase family